MQKTPLHVGIIMDGNGRWANLKGKKRSYGHKAGSDNVERIVAHAYEKGIKTLLSHPTLSKKIKKYILYREKSTS